MGSLNIGQEHGSHQKEREPRSCRRPGTKRIFPRSTRPTAPRNAPCPHPAGCSMLALFSPISRSEPWHPRSPSASNLSKSESPTQGQAATPRGATAIAVIAPSDDTRRKILVGAIVLAKVEQGVLAESVLRRWLDAALSRPDDRELFNLPVGGDERGTWDFNTWWIALPRRREWPSC
jgi:hypothetical protein